MSDVLTVAAEWWKVPLGLTVAGVVLGFIPSTLLRLIVLLYPKHHPRRKELFGELYSLDYLKRIPWIYEQLETGIFEGIRARRKSSRTRRQMEDLIMNILNEVPGSRPWLEINGRAPDGTPILIIFDGRGKRIRSKRKLSKRIRDPYVNAKRNMAFDSSLVDWHDAPDGKPFPHH